MKSNCPYWFVVIMLTVVVANGQGRTTFVGIDAGFQTIASKYADKGFIRGDNAPWLSFDNSSSEGLSSEFFKTFAGIGMERRIFHDKFRVHTGLLYSELNGYLKKHANPNYYYLLYNETGTTTEYLRVMEIHQRSGYLGIPLEVRYSPFGNYTYFMAGGNLNYRLFTTNKTTFNDPEMDKYQSGVNEVVGAPNPWYASFYGGVGWRLGKEGKPHYGIALTAPIVMTHSVSTLMKPTVGLGIHLEVLFPIKPQK